MVYPESHQILKSGMERCLKLQAPKYIAGILGWSKNHISGTYFHDQRRSGKELEKESKFLKNRDAGFVKDDSH